MPTETKPRRQTAPADTAAAPPVRYVFAALAFFILLTAVGALSFLLVKPTVSDIENRPLAALPAFSWESLAAGRFTDELTVYYADTFPAREGLIEAAAWLRGLRGLKAEDGATIHWDVGANEGAGNGGQPLPEAETPPVETPPAPTERAEPSAAPPSAAPEPPAPSVIPSAEPLPDDLEGEVRSGVLVVGDTALELFGASKVASDRYAALVNSFHARYGDGVAVSVLLTPTNVAFKIPERYRSMSADQREAITYIYDRLDGGIGAVWVYDALALHSEEYLYFRTDHHWTGLGAYYAFAELMASQGRAARPLDSYETVRLDGFLGSLYNAVGGGEDMKKNPDYVIAYQPRVAYEMVGYEKQTPDTPYPMKLIYGPEEIRTSNKYIAFAGGDVAYVRIITQNKNGRRLIVFKESFGNAVLPLLADEYEEIHVVDFRHYTRSVDALIQENGINEALFINYIAAASAGIQVSRLETALGG
jgi:hypothetical protein